jgi:hypothetical protein
MASTMTVEDRGKASIMYVKALEKNNRFKN